MARQEVGLINELRVFMILGFDTSALNWLHDDSASNDLIRGLLIAGEIQVSFLNILELARTPHQSRRESLLEMVLRLSANKRPIEDPHELLKSAIEAYDKRRSNLTLANAISSRTSWDVMNRPAAITQDLLDDLKVHYEAREAEFQQVHQRMREEIRKLLNTGRIDRIDRASDLLRIYEGDPEFLVRIVNIYYEAFIGKKLPQSEVYACLETLPWLSAFLTGWGFSIYKKGVSETGYGKQSNAGILDQYYATYLPNYTRFITADEKQRVLLRFCARFVGLNCSVISFDRWRTTMVL